MLHSACIFSDSTPTQLMVTTNDFIANFKKHGISLTPEQFTILARLKESDGLNQKILADYAYKNVSSITRILDSLEKKKFIGLQN